ncbi:Alpha/Beta hydrolase protein [Cercophora newfieldiana]|uniref:Alpha/Beta hydrolase protein n=1 Tax=Cercophora newfieldiana TaxID=92897 RepID=A0AA40CQ30_9PEZI|nr:Alpha/Beta hydrolase protein [Cercophora newfieldiana]
MSTQEVAPTLLLEAGGTNFAYRIIGSPMPALAPLLLLNHFRSTINLWDPLLVDALVQNGIQVFTYDYAGTGHSSGDVKLSIRGFASDLAAFLHALLPTLPNAIAFVNILGFSIGGYVAQQLALDAPDLVGKMILAGTGPSSSLSTIGHVRPMVEVQSAIMTDPPVGAPTINAFFPPFFPSPNNTDNTIGNA